MTAGPLLPFLSSWLHFPSSSRDGLHRRNVPVDQLGFNANKKGSRWIMWRRKVAVQSFGHSSLILHSFIIHFLLFPSIFSPSILIPPINPPRQQICLLLKTFISQNSQKYKINGRRPKFWGTVAAYSIHRGRGGGRVQPAGAAAGQFWGNFGWIDALPILLFTCPNLNLPFPFLLISFRTQFAQLS